MSEPLPGARLLDAGPSGDDTIQSSRIAGRDYVEIHASARPDPSASGFEAQSLSACENLRRLIGLEGGSLRDIVAEKVFLSDIRSQVGPFDRIRREFMEGDGGAPALSPATTLVQQPPARPGQLLEIQAVAVLPGGSGRLISRRMEGLPPGASGRVVEVGELRHLYLAGVVGGTEGDGLDAYGQASSMFRCAEVCLGAEQIPFRDVLRTWIHLPDIDRTYADLNRARSEFFTQRGVRPAPASTGIQGVVYPPDRKCGLSLTTIVGRKRVPSRPVHAPTMNEAPSYGSDFSRGIAADLPDRRVIYVSGTASIDAEGRVVHVGDIEGQVDRMLLNVEEILAGQGTGYAGLVSAITYLKRPEFLEPFRRVAARRGLAERIPNSIVVAGVCRPEWLCEIEAVAVLL